MTEGRKNRLRNKLRDSRARLMSSHPFFALLLMYLKFVAVPEMKKISTNGRCIFFAPDFVDKLHWHELDFILCHQIMHILGGDIWRPTDFRGDNFHLACDIRANAILYNMGFQEERYAHLGYVQKTIPASERDPLAMKAEEILEMLPFNLYALDERTRARFLPDNDERWDDRDNHGTGGIMILNVDEMDTWFHVSDAGGNDSDAPLRQKWKAREAIVSKALSNDTGIGKGTGTLPDFAKRMLGKVKEPTVDWRKALIDFIQERVSDYSFSPPDRRYEDTGFFLPDFNERDFISREILFMVDTSGSVTDDQLALVYSELCGAIEQFSGSLEAVLGFFDADVKELIPFSNVDELLCTTPVGGGGTDFRAIFYHLRSCRSGQLPACVVIITDGFGPFPEESDTMDIPILWLINNKTVTPPIGKTVRIQGDAK